MYTSGRTVKSKAAKPTTIASATADARKLVRKHLPDAQGITVDSRGTADPKTLEHQIRTTITYGAEIDASDLALAVEKLPGYVSSTWTHYAITILRAVCDVAQMNDNVTSHACGVSPQDHCPRCGECECPVTRGVVHPNAECGYIKRIGTLTPFSTGSA